MKTRLARLIDRTRARWCYAMHPDPMWPVRGEYQCPKCQRRFPVPWEEKPRTNAAEATDDLKELQCQSA